MSIEHDLKLIHSNEVRFMCVRMACNTFANFHSQSFTCISFVLHPSLCAFLQLVVGIRFNKLCPLSVFLFSPVGVCENVTILLQLRCMYEPFPIYFERLPSTLATYIHILKWHTMFCIQFICSSSDRSLLSFSQQIAPCSTYSM